MSNQAIIGAFLLGGLHDAGWAATVNSAHRQGVSVTTLIAGLCQFAPHIERLYNLPLEHPDVFHYAVTVPFGDWYGRRVRSGARPTVTQAEEQLGTLAGEYFQADLARADKTIRLIVEAIAC